MHFSLIYLSKVGPSFSLRKKTTQVHRLYMQEKGDYFCKGRNGAAGVCCTSQTPLSFHSFVPWSSEKDMNSQRKAIQRKAVINKKQKKKKTKNEKYIR